MKYLVVLFVLVILSAVSSIGVIARQMNPAILGSRLNYAIPEWEWAKSVGGASNEHGYSIAVDASGNSFVTGMFASSSITFGTTTLTNNGTYDMYVVKYDGNGDVLWATSAGGSNWEDAICIAVDGSGNSYVTGQFTSPSITFGTTTLTNNAGNAGSSDTYVVKYDGSGNVLWATSAGGANTDAGRSIAVDADGNSYVTGYYQSSSITFGSTTLTNNGEFDIFVVKYDGSGSVIWTKSAGGTTAEFGYSIAVDASGNSFVTGMFTSSTITFGTTILTNSGEGDMYVVKYDGGGNVLWATNAVGTTSDFGRSVAVDASGNSYVTGTFTSSSITFGTTTLTDHGVSNNLYVVKYDGTGNVLWAKSEGTSHNGSSIAVDASGNSFVTGPQIYVVKYDPNGNVLWGVPNTGGVSGEYGRSIAVDASGNSMEVLICGLLNFMNGGVTQASPGRNSMMQMAMVLKILVNLVSKIGQSKLNRDRFMQ